MNRSQTIGIKNGGPKRMTRMERMHEQRLVGAARRKTLLADPHTAVCSLQLAVCGLRLTVHPPDPRHPLRPSVLVASLDRGVKRCVSRCSPGPVWSVPHGAHGVRTSLPNEARIGMASMPIRVSRYRAVPGVLAVAASNYCTRSCGAGAADSLIPRIARITANVARRRCPSGARRPVIEP